MLANVTIKRSEHVPGAETRITLLQTVLTLTRHTENVGRSVTWQVCVSIFWNSAAARVRMQPRLVGTAARVATCHLSVPRGRCMRWKSPPVQVRWAVRIQSWLDRSEDFDIGSVSEGTLEPRGADEKFCSMDAPSVREGESVDIEIRVLKHAEKRSRCKEGRIDKDEKKRRKMKAESVSPGVNFSYVSSFFRCLDQTRVGKPTLMRCHHHRFRC